MASDTRRFVQKMGESTMSLEQMALTGKFKIGPSLIECHFSTSELSRYFSTAISHLEADSSQTDLTVFFVDQQASDFELPVPFWSWDTLDSQGNIMTGDEKIRINYHYEEQIFELIDLYSNAAYFVVGDLDKVPYWFRSFPLRTILNWWFEPSSLQAVHSACLSFNGKGVLLAGQGGSGKSNTALTSLLAGISFLGDDFVLVDTESAIAFSLYSIAKLDEKDIERYPQLQDHILNPDHAGDEKAQIDLNQQFGRQLMPCTELKAILVPRVANQQETLIKPCSEAVALQALAPSTIHLLRGDRNMMFSKMSRLVRSLPSFELQLGSNREEIVARLQEFAANHL